MLLIIIAQCYIAYSLLLSITRINGFQDDNYKYLKRDNGLDNHRIAHHDVNNEHIARYWGTEGLITGGVQVIFHANDVSITTITITQILINRSVYISSY